MKGEGKPRMGKEVKLVATGKAERGDDRLCMDIF